MSIVISVLLMLSVKSCFVFRNSMFLDHGDVLQRFKKKSNHSGECQTQNVVGLPTLRVYF